MDDLPLGAWYCLRCVKKKLESGVCSVSKGAESICDVKEVDVLDVDGTQLRLHILYFCFGNLEFSYVSNSMGSDMRFLI